MAAEASELGLTSAVGLEWRRVSGSGVLETVLSHVDSLQASHSHGSGRYLEILFHLEKIIL